MKSARAALILFALAAALPVRAQQSGAPPGERLARRILGELVAINTTLSTGSTAPATRALAAHFRRAGYRAADVIVAGPNAKQQNLVVRLRGRDRSLKAVGFNAHLDVVEAPTLEWASDPFVLTERAGYLHGRGVLDDKGPAASIAAAFIMAKQRGIVPERDLVLSLTAGEETGIGNGVEWLLASRRALVDAEYVLNLDAGGAEMENGRMTSFGIQAAEKTYVDVALTVRGAGGHSSVPPRSTPNDGLARAVLRVNQHRFPVKLNPVVRSYFANSARLGGEYATAMAALAREPDDLGAQSKLLESDGMSALLRSTCVTTVLHGGSAPNAIPQQATANVNCRLLPGEQPAALLTTLRSVIADSTVELTIASEGIVAGPSLPPPAIIALVSRAVAAIAPGIPVIPYMESGGTDAGYFRNAGIPTYGVNGLFVDAGDVARMHGRDERISVRAFGDMVRYMEHLLAAAGGFRIQTSNVK